MMDLFQKLTILKFGVVFYLYCENIVRWSNYRMNFFQMKEDFPI